MEKTRYPGIFKRGRRYVAVVSHRDAQGHRRQQWLTRSTATEARDAKRDREVEIGKGLRPASSKATVETFLTDWLDGISRGVGRPRQQPARPLTVARYAAPVKREIVPTLGHVQLKDLTPELVETWSVGKRYAYMVLSSALSLGVRRKMLQAPARPWSGPRPRTSAPQRCSTRGSVSGS